MLAQNPCGVDAALLSVNNTVKLSLSQPHLFYVERSAQGIIFFVSIYCVCSCTYNMLQRSVTPPMHPISINGFYVQIVLAMVVPKSLFGFKHVSINHKKRCKSRKYNDHLDEIEPNSNATSSHFAP